MKYIIFTLFFFVAVSAEYHDSDGYLDEEGYGESNSQGQGRSLLKPAKKIKEKLGLAKAKTSIKKPSLLKPGSSILKSGKPGKHEIHNPISDIPVRVSSINSGVGHKYGHGSTGNVKMASSGHRPHTKLGSSKIKSGGGILSGQYGSKSGGHGHRIRNPVGVYDGASFGHSNIKGSQGGYYSDAGYHHEDADYLY